LLETPGFVHSSKRNGLRIGEQQVNKNELVAAVAEEAGITKADAGNAIDAVFNAIEGALKKGDDVRIVGFGTFAVASRAATTGRNPRTGETIQIKASKQPKFKAGKGLKDALN
jgi:DNA-binding protein HU-beta